MASNAQMITSPSQKSPAIDNQWIPAGFAVIVGPENHRYIVPKYMVPAIEHQFRGEENKVDMNAIGAAGSVSICQSYFWLPRGYWLVIVHSMPGTGNCCMPDT